MAADIEMIAHCPKRMRRYDEGIPGRVARLRPGREHLGVPVEQLDVLNAWDAGRPGTCYIITEPPDSGLIPTWSDITPGSLIDGATKFGVGQNSQPVTFAWRVTWASNSEGLLLKLGNATTGGISIGRLDGPSRLAVVVGLSDADKAEATASVGAETDAEIGFAFNPVGSVLNPDPALKVWLNRQLVINIPHPYTRWQGDFDDDGGYHRAETDQLDLDAPNAIGGGAMTNGSMTTNLFYFANQLPTIF